MSVQDVDTVSLDRVAGDHVFVEPVEAYAVLQFVWERLRTTRDSDGRMWPLPALSALAISATGDIDAMQPARDVSRSMRPPHEIAQELGHLLLQLVSSGRPDLVGIPVACLDVIRRVSMRAPVPGGLRPIQAPEALFTAFEQFRPRDTYAARAALFARWRSSRSARSARADARPGRRVDATPAVRDHGTMRRPGSAVHRAGRRPRRAAFELRLQFDPTPAALQAQAIESVRDTAAASPRTISRGRLSLVVTMCLAVLGMMQG
jgi:hypothetical protein